MAARMLRTLVCLLLVLSMGAGCAAGVSSNYLEWAQRSYANAPDATLGPRDRFSIEVYPEASLNRAYVVSPEGAINHPLLGPLRVAGRTCHEVQTEIERRLRESFLRDPSVSCTVEETHSQQVVVIGAVTTPGPIAFTSGLTVIDLVSRVGGFTATASKDRVQITRVHEGEKSEIVVPVQQVIRGRAPNILIWPGDIVYVPNTGLMQ